MKLTAAYKKIGDSKSAALSLDWTFHGLSESSTFTPLLVARALKNSQLTCGERHAYFGDRALARDFSHGFLGRKLPARKASGSIYVSGDRPWPVSFFQ